MFGRLWESLGEAVTGRWALTSFGPTLVFWGGGLLAWAQAHDLAAQVSRWDKLSVAEQIAWAIVGLIWVALWTTLMERAQTGLLRLAEGYWPSWLDWLRNRLAESWAKRIESHRAKLDRLGHSVTMQDLYERRRLDAELARLPVRWDQTMPTRLGNILRAAEEYPSVRYGLASGVCWPRLYPLLSAGLREALGQARATLNEMVRLTVWSLAFMVWVVWQPWALAGLPIAWLTYRGMVQAAGVYGDLIRAAFDLHRFDLYKALSWPLPDKPEGETMMGKQLTEYLFRGVPPQGLSFAHKKAESDGQAEGKIRGRKTD
jgi:hypothetical protein